MIEFKHGAVALSERMDRMYDRIQELLAERAALKTERDALRKELQKRPRGSTPHGLYWGKND